MKYHLITFGCQMNKSDSERIRSILSDINIEETDSEEEADFILLNTCSVRQTAETRIYSLADKYGKWKKEKPNLIIGVTGCMPGRDHDGKIRKKLPMVDLFFDIQRITELPQMLSEFNYDIPNKNPLDEHYLKIHPKYKNQFQAFIPIQNGCNKYCTYCVVPFSRGREINRPLLDVLREIRSFAEQGGKEITLLGQTVNSFTCEDTEHFSKENPFESHFAKLLWEVNQVDGIERIHFTAPHPRDMQDDVIEALALPKHVNFIHLPVQSGSNKILKRMNRPYTRELFIDLIKKIRKRNPNIAIGTDIIVGFCDETPEDFAETLSLYQECDFDISYHAQYSPRTGTLAYKGMKDNVSREDKKKRWTELQNLMEEITYRKNQKFQDQEVSVLFDNYDPVKKLASGWSREMKKVQVKSPMDLTGQILNVIIEKPELWVLEGKLLSEPEAVNKPKTKGLPMVF